MAYSNAIFYVDLVNGNDAIRSTLSNAVASNSSGAVLITYNNHGLTTGAVVTLAGFTAYLNGAWKITVVNANSFTLDTAVWATTADPTGDVVPYGGTRTDPWKTVTSGATSTRIKAGDEVRISKTPDFVSIGQNATWTSISSYPNHYIPIQSSTNASPIQITSSIAHNLTTGDYVHISAHNLNTNANGLWKVTIINATTFTLDGSTGNGTGVASGLILPANHLFVKLATPVTELISDCESNWTQGTNVTTSLDTANLKVGKNSIKFVTAAGTGANQILGKLGLAAPLDLSGYEQISFWIKTTVAYNAGDLQILLYSDAACTNLVETLNCEAIPWGGYWRTQVINKGAPLSNTVQGIALYTTVAQPSRTINIDNIIACKAASNPACLTHRTFIAKNIQNIYGDHIARGIAGIIGTDVYLDQYTGYQNVVLNANNTPRGYYGISETVTLYKRDSIVQEGSAAISGGAWVGNSNSIAYLGGWDLTSDVRNGITLIFGNGSSNGWDVSSKSSITLKNIQFSGYYRAIYNLGLGTNNLENVNYSNCFMYGYNNSYTGAINNIITGDTFALHCGYGAYFAALATVDNFFAYSGKIGVQGNAIINKIYACNNSSYGIRTAVGMSVTTIEEARYNIDHGVYIDASIEGIRIIKVTHNYGVYTPTVDVAGVNITGIRVVLTFIEEVKYNKIGIRFAGTNAVIKEINKIENNEIAFATFQNGAYDGEVLKVTSCQNNNKVIYFGGTAINFWFYNLDVSNNVDRSFTMGGYTIAYFINCVGFPDLVMNAAQTSKSEGRIYLHNIDKLGTNHQIICWGGHIQSDTVERHTASGLSWKTALIKNWRDEANALILSIRKTKVTAGDTVLISAWVKKSHATDIGAKLMLRSYKHIAIASDINAYASNNTNWQLVSFQITALVTEVIDLEFAVFNTGGADGTPYYAWIDDVAVTKV